MQFSKNSLAKCLMSAALLGSVGSFAQTVSEPTAPPTSASRSFTNDLAKASLAKDGVTNPSTAQLSSAQASIQAQRDSGLGWGQIANALGLNLGAVVSAANRAEPAQANTRRDSQATDTHQNSQSATGANRGGPGAGGSAGNGGGNGGGGGGGKGGGHGK